jgi:hypothetical protein
MTQSAMRRIRILAFLLDLLVCAAVADAVGLVLTGILWFSLRGLLGAIPWIWLTAAAGGLFAFLLRDASGGRARRWLGLEVVGPEGRSPGRAASLARNLPCLVPIWNLLDAWPMLRDGSAQRRCDRRLGIRVLQTG